MNSLRAFNDAATLSKGQVTQVIEARTSNSVWFCQEKQKKSFALKYFPFDEHGKIHYDAEKSLILNNQSIDIIPDLIEYNDESQWIATRFVESNPNSSIHLDEILDTMSHAFLGLKIASIAHENQPGILGSNLSGLKTTPVKRIIENELKKLEWFPEFIKDIRENWRRDSIIHGDMKLNNVILGQNELKFFDWENVNIGIAKWDYVGLLQSVIVETLGNQYMHGWAKSNLNQSIDFIQGLDDFARKCFAVRCVQSAFEITESESQISRQSLNMLQIADNSARNESSGLRELSIYASRN